MMPPRRPLYETKDDREKQKAAIDELVSFLKKDGGDIRANEAPRLYPYDYEILKDGKPLALVEVKCRNARMDAYVNYMVSASKIRTLREQAHIREVSPWLLVDWSDCIGYADADKAASRGITAYGGRYDRDDPMDREVMTHIPFSVFTIFKKKATSS